MDLFFTIELSRVKDSPNNADWSEYEKHPQLWTARNRIAMMLQNNPDHAGHFRIICCHVMKGLDSAYL